jgi:hypothetical protein
VVVGSCCSKYTQVEVRDNEAGKTLFMDDVIIIIIIGIVNRLLARFACCLRLARYLLGVFFGPED